MNPASKDFYLHDIPFENLNDAPLFEFDFTLLQADKSRAPHYETSLKLKARQVFTRIDEIRKKGEASFAYKLFERYPDKPFEEEKPEYRSPGKGETNYTMPNREGSIGTREIRGRSSYRKADTRMEASEQF